MLFNSSSFALFLPVVLLGYYLLQGRLRAQNAWLLAASYVFYGWWNWRYLPLLAGMTIVAFGCGAAIARSTTHTKRKVWLYIAIAINLGALGFYKYFDFFQQSVAIVMSGLGVQFEPTLLKLALPIGISFFAFQGLSYVIDVYRRETPPVRSFVEFAVFKAFFPQLVAGPIERANHMLPQLYEARHTTAYQIASGMHLLLWGLFKKTVIADNLATVANPIFDDYASQSSADLLIGMLAFSFQIYCDFSGYSDIARGVARLLGFELVINFSRPYFAASPSDFWRRWHISLSQWLRDYLYIVLGGNRGGKWLTARNLMVTMLLGGLWHGAAWNFVAWGAYHGFLLVVFQGLGAAGQRLFGRRVATIAKATWPVRVSLMFALTVVGWVLFRGESMSQVFHMLTHVGFVSSDATASYLRIFLAYVIPLVVFEALAEFKPNLMQWHYKRPMVQACINAILICIMLVFASREPAEFIYFDF